MSLVTDVTVYPLLYINLYFFRSNKLFWELSVDSQKTRGVYLVKMAVTSASVRSGSSAFCTYLRAFSLTPGMCEFTIYTSDTRQSETAEYVMQIQMCIFQISHKLFTNKTCMLTTKQKLKWILLIAMMHLWHNGGRFHCNARLTSWHTLTAYFVLSLASEGNKDIQKDLSSEAHQNWIVNHSNRSHHQFQGPLTII